MSNFKTSLITALVLAFFAGAVNADSATNDAQTWATVNGGRFVACQGDKCVVHQYKPGGLVEVVKLQCNNGAPHGAQCTEIGRNTVKY